MCMFGLILMLVSCVNNSGPTFKGEGVNWSGELITKYDFWSKESQSIRITYIGENLEHLSKTKVIVDSPDFLGWGIGTIELDDEGSYYRGDAFEIETKTPSSSKIILTIEGNESETISLGVSS